MLPASSTVEGPLTRTLICWARLRHTWAVGSLRSRDRSRPLGDLARWHTESQSPFFQTCREVPQYRSVDTGQGRDILRALRDERGDGTHSVTSNENHGSHEGVDRERRTVGISDIVQSEIRVLHAETQPARRQRIFNVPYGRLPHGLDGKQILRGLPHEFAKRHDACALEAVVRSYRKVESVHMHRPPARRGLA